MTYFEAVGRIEKLKNQIENLNVIYDRRPSSKVEDLITQRERELLDLRLLITDIETQ